MEKIIEHTETKRYSQNEFSKLVKTSRKKLQGMAEKGIFVPNKDGDAKNAPCYYTETHLQNFSEALREYDELKKANRKKALSDNSGNLFGEDTADTKTGSEENQADRADDVETDGSEEDADEETFKAVIQTDDDDPDDELIDPPEVTAAEMKCGELLNLMPKATANNNVSGKAKDDTQIPSAGKLGNDESEDAEEPPQKPKLEVAKEMGFNKNQVSQFQTLADNPAVNKVQSVVDVPTPMIADTPKNFLPMMTAPNFDEIPQLIKGLRRWLCWRLIPAPTKQDPNHKNKPPMTPKNGRLVNADVTNPENWLTYEEAQSWYKRGECSGIGFVLTNADPKICCVDVDHCINPDGSLNDEAKAVLSLCSNSWTEISQSGSGIHVWFIDEEFYSDRGRKKGNVEVYAFGRYIAMTGNHIQSTAPDLLTVNGACHNVIDKFIDADIDKPNLFDTPARNEDSKFFDVAAFDTNAPMNLDDCRLIEYFQSEKCRERDLNMFDLFSGNITQYFKNTGKPLDDSVADEHLMLKILYYVGGNGSDEEIGCRALKIFGQSALAKRGKWEREDYQLRTLQAAFKHWTENGRKSYQSKTTDEGTKPIDLLKAKLRSVNKDLADFDTEKNLALEKLRDLETFDSQTVFSEEILQAAAFADIYDKQLSSGFKRDVKNYGDKHPEKKVRITDWLADVKCRAKEITQRKADLMTRRNSLQAQINSQAFVDENDLLAGRKIPDGFTISKEFGTEKISGEDMILVCRRPVVITEKFFSVEDQITKLSLAYMTTDGKWKILPPTEKAIVANKNKIVDLANNDLPVTSCNAAQMVDYLDAFNVTNENALPLTYTVPRCGWHSIKGKDYFIDPRLDCVITVDDKNISVKVDNYRSDFAKHCRQVGSLEEWKKAYALAKKSPVARIIVAAAVAPILLKILGERNFLLYIYAPTRAGKTTGLEVGRSAVGDEKIIRSFDATKNGLAGAAADVSDFAFFVDEKQVADGRLKDQFDTLTYALANGIGRTKLNKDSTLRKLADWRTIAIMTGETQMLSDNVTGGANTRLMSIAAPKEILSADDCKTIRDITKDNFGFALPLVINKVKEIGNEKLREIFKEMTDVFKAKFPEILDEYRRYMAELTIADTLLNAALYGNTVTTDDGKTIKASDDAIINAVKIFPLIPTKAEIDDTPREKEFVRSFITQNQGRFIGGNIAPERMQSIFGKLNDPDGYTYITVQALKDACKNEGFDYRKLVADLVADGFFVPIDKIKKGCKKPLDTVQKKIGETNATCYRIPQVVLDEEE